MVAFKFPVGSREIIEQFLESGEPIARIPWEETNREKESVYVALLRYVERTEEERAVIRRLKGEIYLLRSEFARTDFKKLHFKNE